jgi:hypothetical protein
MATTAPILGRCQFVVASRFVQATPAATTSPILGRCQFEVSSALTNIDSPVVVTPPSGGGGGGGGVVTPPVDPGAGVNPGVTVTNPRGKFTLWAPTVSYTGWGGD